jgi:hypothetical protein
VISPPNSRHSEARNSHIASFVDRRPVDVYSMGVWMSDIAHSATEGSSAQPVSPTTITSAPAATSHQEYRTP